jgi:hypothetical protein
VVKAEPEVDGLELARTAWNYFQPGVGLSSDDFQQEKYIDLSFDLNFNGIYEVGKNSIITFLSK